RRSAASQCNYERRDAGLTPSYRSIAPDRAASATAPGSDWRVRLMLHPLRKFGKVAGRVAVGLWLGDRVRDIVKPRTSRYDYRPGQAAQLYANFCVWIDQTIGWPKLPTYVGLAVLLGERTKLRQDNLQDTSVFPTLPQPEPQAKGTAYLRERMPDGSFNDL